MQLQRRLFYYSSIIYFVISGQVVTFFCLLITFKYDYLLIHSGSCVLIAHGVQFIACLSFSAFAVKGGVPSEES